METILLVPVPSPVTLVLSFADQAYVTPVMPFDTSLLSNTTVNCTSEQDSAVPAIPTGSGFIVIS